MESEPDSQGTITIDRNNIPLTEEEETVVQKVESGEQAFKKEWVADDLYIVHIQLKSKRPRLLLLRTGKATYKIAKVQ